MHSADAAPCNLPITDAAVDVRQHISVATRSMANKNIALKFARLREDSRASNEDAAGSVELIQQQQTPAAATAATASAVQTYIGARLQVIVAVSLICAGCMVLLASAVSTHYVTRSMLSSLSPPHSPPHSPPSLPSPPPSSLPLPSLPPLSPPLPPPSSPPSSPPPISPPPSQQPSPPPSPPCSPPPLPPSSPPMLPPLTPPPPSPSPALPPPQPLQLGPRRPAGVQAGSRGGECEDECRRNTLPTLPVLSLANAQTESGWHEYMERVYKMPITDPLTSIDLNTFVDDRRGSNPALTLNVALVGLLSWSADSNLLRVPRSIFRGLFTHCTSLAAVSHSLLLALSQHLAHVSPIFNARACILADLLLGAR